MTRKRMAQIVLGIIVLITAVYIIICYKEYLYHQEKLASCSSAPQSYGPNGAPIVSPPARLVCEHEHDLSFLEIVFRINLNPALF